MNKMVEVHLRDVDHSGYDKGAGIIKRSLWFFVSALLVEPKFIPFMKWKLFWLRLFGAKIGKRTCLKPCVIVRSPWNLVVGDDCWIGDYVWIDNLDKVYIGSNVCISQRALILTGNHDYKNSTMPYRNAPVKIEDGAWVGASTTVCAGVTIHENAVLTVGAMTSKDLDGNGIYQGVPALKVRERKIIK